MTDPLTDEALAAALMHGLGSSKDKDETRRELILI